MLYIYICINIFILNIHCVAFLCKPVFSYISWTNNRIVSLGTWGVNQAAFKAAERAFKALNERHSGLCEELQRAEEQACKLEQAIETCELRCAGLDFASENDESHSDLKDEIRNWFQTCLSIVVSIPIIIEDDCHYPVPILAILRHHQLQTTFKSKTTLNVAHPEVWPIIIFPTNIMLLSF